MDELLVIRPDLQAKLEKASELCLQAQSILREVLPELRNEIDKAEINRIMTELAWACENTFVIGFHTVGRYLDDKMGYT